MQNLDVSSNQQDLRFPKWQIEEAIRASDAVGEDYDGLLDVNEARQRIVCHSR